MKERNFAVFEALEARRDVILAFHRLNVQGPQIRPGEPLPRVGKPPLRPPGSPVVPWGPAPPELIALGQWAWAAASADLKKNRAP